MAEQQNSIDLALVAAIKRSGKTAKQIAAELGDVIDHHTVSNLLSGRSHPTTTTAALIADLFGLRLR